MMMNVRIKKTRTDAGESLRAFGENIGITASSVYKIEKGENNPCEQTLRLISTVYKVNHDWLAEGRGEPYLPPDTDDELVDEVMAGANEFAKKPSAPLPGSVMPIGRSSSALWMNSNRRINPRFATALR